MYNFRENRKKIIKAKYEDKQFVKSYCANAQDVFERLQEAINEHSLIDLLRVYGEASRHGVELTDPLPTSVS